MIFFPIKMQCYTNVKALNFHLVKWEGDSFAGESWSCTIFTLHLASCQIDDLQDVVLYS